MPVLMSFLALVLVGVCFVIFQLKSSLSRKRDIYCMFFFLFRKNVLSETKVLQVISFTLCLSQIVFHQDCCQALETNVNCLPYFV